MIIKIYTLIFFLFVYILFQEQIIQTIDMFAEIIDV